MRLTFYGRNISPQKMTYILDVQNKRQYGRKRKRRKRKRAIAETKCTIKKNHFFTLKCQHTIAFVFFYFKKFLSVRNLDLPIILK